MRLKGRPEREKNSTEIKKKRFNERDLTILMEIVEPVEEDDGLGDGGQEDPQTVKRSHVLPSTQVFLDFLSDELVLGQDQLQLFHRFSCIPSDQATTSQNPKCLLFQEVLLIGHRKEKEERPRRKTTHGETYPATAQMANLVIFSSLQSMLYMRGSGLSWVILSGR